MHLSVGINYISDGFNLQIPLNVLESARDPQGRGAGLAGRSLVLWPLEFNPLPYSLYGHIFGAALSQEWSCGKCAGNANIWGKTMVPVNDALTQFID